MLTLIIKYLTCYLTVERGRGALISFWLLKTLNLEAEEHVWLCSEKW